MAAGGEGILVATFDDSVHVLAQRLVDRDVHLAKQAVWWTLSQGVAWWERWPEFQGRVERSGGNVRFSPIDTEGVPGGDGRWA
jgi:hypothetical protein